MSNAYTPEMMAQSMAESLLRENKALKEQNAMLTVQLKRHQWQPIETAPRDGTPVDLWHKSGGRIPETWWDEEDQCWSCVMDDDCFSHWMPMPEVPGISALPQQVKSEDARDDWKVQAQVLVRVADILIAEIKDESNNSLFRSGVEVSANRLRVIAQMLIDFQGDYQFQDGGLVKLSSKPFVQACRPEDREMVRSETGSEMIRAAIAAISAQEPKGDS